MCLSAWICCFPNALMLTNFNEMNSNCTFSFIRFTTMLIRQTIFFQHCEFKYDLELFHKKIINMCTSLVLCLKFYDFPSNYIFRRTTLSEGHQKCALLNRANNNFKLQSCPLSTKLYFDVHQLAQIKFGGGQT